MTVKLADLKGDIEEYNNCLRSPLYFYNKYVRKEGEPELSQAQFLEHINRQKRKREPKPTEQGEVSFDLIDDTE